MGLTNSTDRRITRCVASVLVVLVLSGTAAAQTMLVGIGDSIGEGVQSADASAASQPFSFINLISTRFGQPFPLPLIQTGIFGQVGNVSGRSRINPTVRTFNLAVSGADVNSALNDLATATTTAQIDSETELVLFPRVGSQIQIAESLNPLYTVAWIGNNDALGAALAYDQLNATQLTPVASFTADFQQIVARLKATGTKAVFGTIPDITGIGLLMNHADLVRFLGSSYGLQPGHLTTAFAMFMVRLGIEDPSVFSDPNWVLDPAEQAIISNHIVQLNDVIRSTVWANGMAVADTYFVFEYLASQPLNLWGVPLTTRFMGGLFSLDGVHPSNIGQGIAAMFFIDALNRTYGVNIPQIDGPLLFALLKDDPFVDIDGDGRVRGRFGAGFIETVFAVLNLTGDTEGPPQSAVSAAAPSTMGAPAENGSSKILARTDKAAVALFEEYKKATGKDLRTMATEERRRAVHELLGQLRLAK